MCVRCSVLGLCSLHRRDDHTSSSLACLASVIEPFTFVSGECSSSNLWYIFMKIYLCKICWRVLHNNQSNELRRNYEFLITMVYASEVQPLNYIGLLLKTVIHECLSWVQFDFARGVGVLCSQSRRTVPRSRSSCRRTVRRWLCNFEKNIINSKLQFV